MIRSDTETALFRDRVQQALTRIASAQDGGEGRIIVNVPVLYPSGATAAIAIDANQGQCFVSDIGKGFVEAEFEGALEFYSKAANATAGRFGVKYDGHSIFTMWIAIDRIEGAIINIANASCEAAALAIRSAAEQKLNRRNEELFRRVTQAFGERSVARRAVVVGRHVTWEAHNVVLLPNRNRAIFEYVTDNANSISGKFLMFSDIRQADKSIALNAVVSSIDQISPKQQLIGEIANILRIKAADQAYRDYAEAS